MVVWMGIKFGQERCQTGKGYLFFSSPETLKYVSKEENVWQILLLIILFAFKFVAIIFRISANMKKKFQVI